MSRVNDTLKNNSFGDRNADDLKYIEGELYVLSEKEFIIIYDKIIFLGTVSSSCRVKMLAYGMYAFEVVPSIMI